jgi:hypothetical protein
MDEPPSSPEVRESPHLMAKFALEALFAVTGGALKAVSKEDARGFFESCGYHTPQDHSL